MAFGPWQRLVFWLSGVLVGWGMRAAWYETWQKQREQERQREGEAETKNWWKR